MSDLETHIERLQALVQHFESMDEGPVRDRVFELLEQVDHLHRSGVWRLFELVTELGGKGLVERISLDPSVKLLFMLYDLIPVDPLHPVEATVQPPPAPHATAAGFIPLNRVGGRKASWEMVLARADLPSGTMRAIQIGGTPVLVCAVGDDVAAFRNACGRSVLPLHLGTLAGDEIRCAWHGCRFDARTGKRLDREGPDLETFSTSVRDGVVYVATNAAKEPMQTAGGR
jgi:nitrite reductase/ring-hydroxylating ferredoxin subunit